MKADETLQSILDKRKKENRFRELRQFSDLTDFCSNDYLGFARSATLRKKADEILARENLTLYGATGSRLLSGNSDYVESLESKIANFHNAQSGLIFNSGYDANLGLFSCIAQRNDTIIIDEYSHASIVDGTRLSLAKKMKFRHNDLQDLEQKLSRATGTIFVAVESVYSMDGDDAPLSELSALCMRYTANLIVDEAHATGLFGDKGRGKVNERGLESSVFGRIHTFGKALGAHGAIVLGSLLLRSYLINYARSFIYSTALPAHSLVLIEAAYELVKNDDKSRQLLFDRIHYFKNKAEELQLSDRLKSESAIQGWILPGNDRVKAAADYLQSKKFDVRPIVSPTVSSGQERIRVCLHAYNTTKEIDSLLENYAVWQKQNPG